MKAYTDIEQSKNLAEILPIESADMSYVEKGNAKSTWYDAENRRITTSYEKKYYIPCWSLAALLSFIPRPDLHQTKDNRWCCIAEPNSMVFSRHFDNPVDACVDMIHKLKEMNYEK